MSKTETLKQQLIRVLDGPPLDQITWLKENAEKLGAALDAFESTEFCFQSICDVAHELTHARRKFPSDLASEHEAYAVLLEEVDELWDEVKGSHPQRKARMRAEAVQIAAMAIRLIEDRCGG